MTEFIAIVVVAIAVLALGLGPLVIQRWVDTQRSNRRMEALEAEEHDTPTVDPRVRSEGIARAEGIRFHKKKPYVDLHVIGSGEGEAVATYRAAYELIVWGGDVRLEMREVFVENGGGAGFDLRARTILSRVTYTTEAFLPYLSSIDSFEDFERYAPFRPDHEMALAVHPDDEAMAYQVLRDLGIRLSPLHHPEQA